MTLQQGGHMTMVRLRETPKKMQLNLGIFQARYDPPPPTSRNFGTFGALFCWLIFFPRLLGHFLCHISPTIWGKSAQKLLDLVNPPPISTKNSQIVGAQKSAPKLLDWPGTPPPPLWEKPKKKPPFFWGGGGLPKVGVL